MGRAPIQKNVQQAFHDVVHEYPGGVEELAGKMVVATGTLYNKANATERSHHIPTLADAVVLTIMSGDKRVLHAFAATVGEVCYSLPDLSNLTTTALIAHIPKIGLEGGDFYRAIHCALATDDRIDAEEYLQIERASYEWIASILEGLARMKEMV